MGWLGDILGGGLSILGFGVGAAENQANLNAQRENLAWMRQAQIKTWAREDNAVQRRIADLRAAGLSPTLAAGSAASTSSPINTSGSVPHSDLGSAFDKAGQMMALMKMKADINQTEEQTRLTKMQQNSIGLENSLKQIEIDYRSKADPYRVTGLQQQTQLASEMNPKKVEEQVKKLRGMDLQYEKLKVDKRLAELGVDLRTVDIDLRKQQKLNEIQRGTLLEKEIAYKRVLAEMIQVQQEELLRNTDIYRMLGLPSNQNLSDVVKGGIITGKALGDLLLKIRGK